jgi:glycosyltransferase involved in cell wall biosynthesis
LPLDVIFVHASRTRRGGIVNAALVHAFALSRRGHRVELWTAAEEVAARAALLGLNAFHSPAFGHSARALASPAVRSALLQTRRRPVDAVIHHGAKLWLAARLAAPPHRQFVVFHNDKLGGRRRFRNWLTLSRTHEAELREMAARIRLRRTVQTIRNGLLPGSLSAAAGAVPDFAAPLRIGALAELRSHKGLDLLLLATSRLVRDGVGVELHIGGTGPERDRLMAEGVRLGIGPAVTWHGWVDDPDRFFQCFDVLCVPSRREPFGLVVIEAMARGKLVVATRTKGPSDILEDGRTGHLVPIDRAALAARLQEIVADPRRSRVIAEAGRSHALQAYSLDAVGRSLEAAMARAQQEWKM